MQLAAPHSTVGDPTPNRHHCYDVHTRSLNCSCYVHQNGLANGTLVYVSSANITHTNLKRTYQEDALAVLADMCTDIMHPLSGIDCLITYLVYVTAKAAGLVTVPMCL